MEIQSLRRHSVPPQHLLLDMSRRMNQVVKTRCGGEGLEAPCWPLHKGCDCPFRGALMLHPHVRNLHTELSVCFYSKWWDGQWGRSSGSCIQVAGLTPMFCPAAVFSSGMTNLWWSIHRVCCCNCLQVLRGTCENFTLSESPHSFSFHLAKEVNWPSLPAELGSAMPLQSEGYLLSVQC